MNIHGVRKLAGASLTVGVLSVFVVLITALVVRNDHLIRLGIYILIASPASSLLFIVFSTLKLPDVWLYGAGSLLVTTLGILLALN